MSIAHFPRELSKEYTGQGDPAFLQNGDYLATNMYTYGTYKQNRCVNLTTVQNS